MEEPPIGLWGVSAVTVPLLGGHRNKAFRTFGLNRDLVFKTTRRHPAAVAWLAPVLKLAEQCGFVVPCPARSSAGRYVEHGWTCEPFIHGEKFSREDMSSIGSQLSVFQDASKSVLQRPGFLSARDFLDRDLGGDVDLRCMPSNLVTLCRKIWSSIERHPTCVVHGDLNPSNLMLTEGKRTAIVDWDECRVDARLFDTYQITSQNYDKPIELAIVAWEVACSWQFEQEYAEKTAAKLLRMASCL